MDVDKDESAISSARTVCGGGRGQRVGARYRVRGRGWYKGRVCGLCAVEGGDKGRERDIECADEGGDKERERDIECADGTRWRARTRGGSATSAGGGSTDGAQWRAETS